MLSDSKRDMIECGRHAKKQAATQCSDLYKATSEGSNDLLRCDWKNPEKLRKEYQRSATIELTGGFP